MSQAMKDELVSPVERGLCELADWMISQDWAVQVQDQLEGNKFLVGVSQTCSVDTDQCMDCGSQILGNHSCQYGWDFDDDEENNDE